MELTAATARDERSGIREAVGADFDGPRLDAAPRSAGSAAAASSSDDILRVPLRSDLVIQRAPQKALDVLAQIKAGAPPPGYKGNAAFANDGRGGGEVLPAAGGSGNAITYKEWDVEPFQKGKNRGLERLVTGSDGSSYYTGDHYKTFEKI